MINIHDLHTESKNDLIKSGVYFIYSLLHPNKVYVGSASRNGNKTRSQNGFWKRWHEHFNDFVKGTHSCTHLQRIVNKYGIDVLRFMIIEFCEPKDCEKVEQWYIDNSNTYNICKVAGSPLGTKRSDNTKYKLSLIKKKENNPNYKNKLGTLKRCSKGNPSNFKSVIMENIATGKITDYLSMTEAAEDIGSCIASILYALKNKSVHKKKYKFYEK